MTRHDFFIAGRWRNHPRVREALEVVRGNGYSTYCFIERTYESAVGQAIAEYGAEDFARISESLDQDDPLIRRVFDADIAALRDAERFLLVFPAGAASHIEAGLAAGWGKPCYAVGAAKTETLYCIFDRIFPDVAELDSWLRGENTSAG